MISGESFGFRPESSLWRDEDPLFEVQFFHPGLFYNRLVAINVVKDGKAEKLAFSPDMFEYGDKALADRVREAPPGLRRIPASIFRSRMRTTRTKSRFFSARPIFGR